ncbi:MAG: NAD(P)-dependent oxidoreductase [Verrucomicrobiae bacterium]|nr:NAD(P)-dependent oxidoreductase [Verrucomicrobiae bacterium]
MDAALISKSFSGSVYTHSRRQTSSLALPHLPSRPPRHDQYEIFGLSLLLMKISSETLKKQEAPSRIAITGGRGRLAGLVANFLNNAGYDVVLFSRTGGEEFQKLNDLLDPVVMATFDSVIHAAWSTVPFISEQDPGREEREDIPLLKKLLEAARLASKEAKKLRFLFFSSASVYGNTVEEPVTEHGATRPISRYAQNKLLAEEMILKASQEDSSFQPILLRITNVLGFLSNPKYPQGILPRMIAAANTQETVTIWGDGRCSKDYLWIDDFLSALQAALSLPTSGIFNIGSGNNFSILELALAVEQALNFVLSVQYHERYAWDVAHSCIDSSKFSKLTGWKPQKNILEEIRKLLV